MKTNTYYEGTVGDTYCKITDRIWGFGSHYIPTHAVSDVIAGRVSTITATIVSGVLALLFFLGWGLSTDFEFGYGGEVLFVISMIFVVIAIIFALYKKVVVTVVSKGTKHVIIDASGSSVKDAMNLYQAMINCLNEGEVYNVNLDIFENSNESDSTTQISGTIEKVDKQIKCPDCGTIIPNDAEECPNCGCPESVFNSSNE